MDITEVIKEPFFSSKRRNFLVQNKFVLTFLVSKKANKVMIRKAMQFIFGVNPLDVNTLNRAPKPARKTLKSRENFTKAKKIAYISLSQEDFTNLRRAIEGEGAPEGNIPEAADIQREDFDNQEKLSRKEEKKLEKKEDKEEKRFGDDRHQNSEELGSDEKEGPED